MTSATMNAVRFYEHGGPEMLHYEEVARPIPGEGEVLIRVHAAGVNPIDWKIRTGFVPIKPPNTFPVILGFDVAGRIEAVGAGVNNFAIGDEVYASPDFGGYAEYVAVAAREV